MASIAVTSAIAACGVPVPAVGLSDAGILSFAFANEAIPVAARVVRNEPLSTLHVRPARATILSIIQAGGRDSLVILREEVPGRSENQAKADSWRTILSLDFAAPSKIPAGLQHSKAQVSSPDLNLRRTIYTGDEFAALRRVALVNQPGLNESAGMTLLIEYAKNESFEYFLYVDRAGAPGLERSYDSQLSELEPEAFLYYNGIESQACLPATGVCPAIQLDARSPAETATPLHFTMRIQNLAPEPAAFQVSLHLAADGNIDGSIDESLDGSVHGLEQLNRGEGEGAICSGIAGRGLVCGIGKQPAVILRLTSGSRIPANRNLIQIEAGTIQRSILPPARSLRRTMPGPRNRRSYLLAIPTTSD